MALRGIPKTWVMGGAALGADLIVGPGIPVSTKKRWPPKYKRSTEVTTKYKASTDINEK
jgi:hypothetical protein